jgi:hypothetical protein
LLEQLQLLSDDPRGQKGRAGDIPTGMREAGDEPIATGSPTLTMTIGIVRVACWAAATFCAAGATMTSMLRRTDSAACAGRIAERNISQDTYPMVLPRLLAAASGAASAPLSEVSRKRRRSMPGTLGRTGAKVNEPVRQPERHVDE